jgi:hypothetical protein
VTSGEPAHLGGASATEPGPAAVHPVFEYLAARGAAQPDFARALLLEMRWAGLLATLASPLLNALSPRVEAHRREFLFYGVRYRTLIEELGPDSALLAGSVRVAPLGVRAGIPFRVTGSQQYRLWRLFQRDPQLRSAAGRALLAAADRVFTTLQPRVLVLANDSLPENRVLILAARRRGIPSLCIQHGIFQRNSDWRWWDGHFADHMLVWGTQQAEAYLQRGMAPGRVHVFGLPLAPAAARAGAARPDTVCLLGQPWEAVSPELGRRKLRLFDELGTLLRERGIDCVYKPHPKERERRSLPRMPLFRGSMAAALAQFGSFVSLTSTALLEASLHGRVGVQLFDPAFNCENFAEAGYSYAVRADRPAELVDLLASAPPPFPVPVSLVRPVDSAAAALRQLVDTRIAAD